MLENDFSSLYSFLSASPPPAPPTPHPPTPTPLLLIRQEFVDNVTETTAKTSTTMSHQGLMNKRNGKQRLLAGTIYLPSHRVIFLGLLLLTTMPKLIFGLDFG